MFGARPLYSHEEPDQVVFDETYDLIWAGSFFTHLDERRFIGFLSVCESALEDDGLFIFTVHSAGHIESFGYREVQEGEAQMLRSYEAEGYGYFQYPGQNYGDALASPAWVTKQLERLPRLRLLTYSIRGWHGYQDLIACVRTAA
jgi:hypothetical protein